VAAASNAVSVISAGWDPGTDSVIRALLEAMAPKGVTYSNFGEGMSMGHSVAAKAVAGVKDALSVTIPVSCGIHKRLVYVVLEPDADIDAVTKSIKTDSYFSKDETIVMPVGSVKELIDVGHGVNLVRKGVSGRTHNQMFEFNMKINNPALTSQIMVCAARASLKMQPGAYTMIEIPAINFLSGSTEDLIRRLV
jgi:diaminopimelate dehydrogenase